MSLSTIPPELHIQINSYLPPLDLYFLSITSRYFFHLISPFRLSYQHVLTVRLYHERIDSARYRRICSKCDRLRQFWHFSHKQASAKTKADVRMCLDCYMERYNPNSTGQRIKWFFGETIVACEKCSKLVRVVDKEVFAHGCQVGRKPVNWASREPHVNRIRDTLDRLEEKLPPRRLLDWRTDDPDVELEDTLVFLEDCAKEHEALAGGAK